MFSHIFYNLINSRKCAVKFIGKNHEFATISRKLDTVTVAMEALINIPGSMTKNITARTNCNKYSGLREK